MKNRWSDWNSDIQLSLLTLTKVRYRYQTKEGWTEEHCFYKLSFSLISSEFDFEVWCSSFGLCPCCTTMYGSPECTNQTLTPERPYSVFHIYSNHCAGRWNKGYFICCSRIARCCDILSTVEAEAEACVKIWFFFFFSALLSSHAVCRHQDQGSPKSSRHFCTSDLVAASDTETSSDGILPPI